MSDQVLAFTLYAPATELADIPRLPRRAFIARADAAGVFAVTLGLLTFIGATAAALGVVASGGALALAAAAAIAGGATAGSAGALLFHRFLSRDEANELETQLAAGGLVLWARVRSPEREDKAQQILLDHGARAVRVHEIKLEKRLEDIPLEFAPNRAASLSKRRYRLNSMSPSSFGSSNGS
jgi:hypothetical protein